MQIANRKQVYIDFDELLDSSFIRQRQLLESRIIPFSASTLWRKISAGEFPAPVKISTGITAWRIGVIRQWLARPDSYKSTRSASLDCINGGSIDGADVGVNNSLSKGVK